MTKKVLITGASQGIGKSILKKFLKKKYKIIGTSRNKYGIKKIKKIIKKNGQAIFLDVSNLNSINNFLKFIKKNIGKIDILINNIGETSDNLITHMSNKEWNYIINVNLNSIFYISKEIIKNMIKQRYGRIINIGSVAGKIGNSGQTNYSASKAALIGFTKSLSLEVAQRGITVNLISPGFIKTKMLKKLTSIQLKRCIQKIPMRKFGKPKDISNLVEFLASDKSEYITGQTFHVNGGICFL
ncbi:MAG: SDR family oxidoreductase [Buchnera aphidicola (Periphyllus acericola)]|uniref:3-oxoacyl-ACP reductase FabG n=1 Tax=Buchnera aphidicola TaxID=9 RepID=UPI0030D2266B|nr:SDR family oxidoreductase [Buchnera aphidicola (Periphyllus acericola)]